MTAGAEPDSEDTMALDLPMASSAEFKDLADRYQAGFEKCLASGYEEFGEKFQLERRMVIAALREASALRALDELQPRS
jgi:hypothetical protein